MCVYCIVYLRHRNVRKRVEEGVDSTKNVMLNSNHEFWGRSCTTDSPMRCWPAICVHPVLTSNTFGDTGDKGDRRCRWWGPTRVGKGHWLTIHEFCEQSAVAGVGRDIALKKASLLRLGSSEDIFMFSHQCGHSWKMDRTKSSGNLIKISGLCSEV